MDENMNAYTDLEQSKKLAEFLPLESADMCYPKDEFEYNYAKEPVCHYSGIGLAHPCWSLAALFKMLPYSARLERSSSTELCYVTLPNELESSDRYVEPIDAVFEMILKLHELKML